MEYEGEMVHLASSNSRETEKRELAKKQIETNFQSQEQDSKFFDYDVKETHLYPVDTYSTKFMSPKDQITLAVDKVETPEIRLTLSPVPTHPRFYANPQAKIYDYESRLSLNDGDEDAFAILADSFSDGTMRKFTMEDSCSFVIAYGKDVIDGTLFVFDLYRKEREDTPVITATFAMTSPNIDAPYTDKMVWEYLITMHEQDNEKPKDAAIKSAYNELREFMRAAIAALGVFPSKL